MEYKYRILYALHNKQEIWDDGSHRHTEWYTQNSLFSTMRHLKIPCRKSKISQLLDKMENKEVEKREGKTEQNTPQAKAEYKILQDGEDWVRKYMELN